MSSPGSTCRGAVTSAYRAGGDLQFPIAMYLLASPRLRITSSHYLELSAIGLRKIRPSPVEQQPAPDAALRRVAKRQHCGASAAARWAADGLPNFEHRLRRV